MRARMLNAAAVGAMPSHSPRLRKLLRGDGPRLVEAAELFDHPISLRSAGRFLRERSVHVWVAYLGGTAGGVLHAAELRQPHTVLRQRFIYRVAVDPAFRRSGVGGALVRRCLAYARPRSFEAAFVFTDAPAHVAAPRLYRSTGGRPETRGDRMYVYRYR